MATGTVIFVTIGVFVASLNLMKLIEVLDTPQCARRAKHTA